MGTKLIKAMNKIKIEERRKSKVIDKIVGSWKQPQWT